MLRSFIRFTGFLLLVLFYCHGPTAVDAAADIDLHYPVHGARMLYKRSTDASKHQYLVHIVRYLWPSEPYNWTMICAGALISQQMILTAASCFDHWKGGLMNIRAVIGQNDSFDGPARLGFQAVSGVFIHPERILGSREINTALVRLSFPAYGVLWKKVLLPRRKETDSFIDNGQQLTVVSIGMSPDDSTNLIKEAKVKLYADACFSNHFSSKYQVCSKDSMSNGFRLCSLDHGSPVILTRPRGQVIVAHASRTNYQCSPHARSTGPADDVEIYTKTTSVMPWILHKVKTYTSNHGLESEMDDWKNVPYDEHILGDTNMDNYNKDFALGL